VRPCWRVGAEPAVTHRRRHSAGYVNGIEKNLPITIGMDRVSSPLGHNLMLRPDHKGQITRLAQLKGKTIATNGSGAVSTYEVGKMLETDGLTIADVDIKVMPFTQMAIAMRNKAIDAAIVIPPFTSQFLDQGHAVAFKDPDDLVKPHPMTIAVSMANTDWAKANDRVVRNYYAAYLRAVRDYCNAYHGGKDRAAMIDLLIKSGTENRRSSCMTIPGRRWHPNGMINTTACSTCSPEYVKSKMSAQQFPPRATGADSYIREAVEKLVGQFAPENKDSKREGCRRCRQRWPPR
jgi:NitT/TauT family transport system substrate-binding protein